MVWRWVTPAQSALEGAHSCGPNVPAAPQFCREPAQCDRGVGCLWLATDPDKPSGCSTGICAATISSLHAASIRCARRAHESEPDIAIHTLVATLSAHRRLSAPGQLATSDCEEVCDGRSSLMAKTGRRLPARSIKTRSTFSHRRQSLRQAVVADGMLQIGKQQFRTVICDPPLPDLPESSAILHVPGALC